MPFYWKRGVLAGLAVGVMMTFLVRKMDPAMTDGQSHHTPFGPLMGFIVLALFCVMPGKQP